MNFKLPLVFDSYFEDPNLFVTINNYCNSVDITKSYCNLTQTIVEKFCTYLEMLKKKYDFLEFKTHIEFTNFRDVTEPQLYIKELATQYGCNHIELKGATAVVLSNNPKVLVTFPSITAACHIDENKELSNFVFFIIIPVFVS